MSTRSAYNKEKIPITCTSCLEEYLVRRDTTYPSRRRSKKMGAHKCPRCVAKLKPDQNRKRLGNLNPNWKNGATSEIQKFYTSREWKELRTKVFIRDNYTCRDCKTVGGRLEANHIKPRCKYPELRLVESNIETLCKKCHDKKKYLVYQ